MLSATSRSSVPRKRRTHGPCQPLVGQRRWDLTSIGEAMIVVMSALGLLFLLTVYLGDVTGASALGFVLAILGCVLWKEREESESPEKIK